MARRLLYGLAACVACAAFVAVAPALGADQGAGAEFHATVDLSATVTGIDTCVHVHAGGPATGTHLGGKASWVDDECVEFTGHLVGHGVFTATNGDQIFVDYQATTPPPDPEIHARGTFTITGGTGHFAGATGGGALAVDGIPGGAELVQFDGTISLGLGTS
jgi:hypothetical protein